MQCKHGWGPFSQAGWEAKSSDRFCGEHFVSGNPSRYLNSVASKFKLCAQPLSAELKMSAHVPNCTLKGFYVLTLLSAMGSDAILQNLQRHISMQACGSWFCTDLESSQALMVTHRLCVDACSLSRYRMVYGYSLFAYVSNPELNV